jgi:CubicO group peptidase (beta-lactamase class C family)
MSTLFTSITTRQILIILLFAAGTLTVSAQSPFATAESFVRECIDDGDTPGLHYVVVSKDSVLVQFSEGLSDLAAGARMNSRTTMMIYSMTKTITAAAVLQLADRGFISLDAPVCGRFSVRRPYYRTASSGSDVRHTQSHPVIVGTSGERPCVVR